MNIKKAWRNLRYIRGREQVNPLLYIFVYFTFVTGVGFAVMSFLHSEHGLTMYQIMVEQSGFGGTFMWGFLALLAAIGVIVALIWQNRYIAEAAAFLGFGLWFYLGWVYGTSGYFDGIIISVIPNISFWVWFSLKIDHYRRVFCHK